MSIYATLWRLRFPSEEDDHTGCAWVEVIAQGVPGHIGAPDPSLSFEDLHRRICDALRGDRPRLVAESWEPDGRVRLRFEDGSVRETRIGSAWQIQRGSHDA